MGQAAIAGTQHASLPGQGLKKATDLIDPRNLGGVVLPGTQGRWCRQALSGYLTELVGGPASANLTMTARLIRDAQDAGEFVAWIATHRDVFFPPDLAAMGVDLATLPVVWADEPVEDRTKAGRGEPGPNGSPTPAKTNRQRNGRPRTAARAGRATERLLRSGAFGLVVIDLAKDLTLNPASQGRLLRLAEHNDAQVLILRRKRKDGNYSGSLVTVRAESSREQIGPGRFRCIITNTKDKREGPGWTTSEVFDGPPGLH